MVRCKIYAYNKFKSLFFSKDTLSSDKTLFYSFDLSSHVDQRPVGYLSLSSLELAMFKHA